MIITDLRRPSKSLTIKAVSSHLNLPYYSWTSATLSTLSKPKPFEKSSKTSTANSSTSRSVAEHQNQNHLKSRVKQALQIQAFLARWLNIFFSPGLAFIKIYITGTKILYWQQHLSVICILRPWNCTWLIYYNKLIPVFTL